MPTVNSSALSRFTDAARRKVAYGIWAVAEVVYPYRDVESGGEEEQSWEITAYLEADAKTADEVFQRMSDATCGVPHHQLDPCPGPSVVMGMHSVQFAEDGANEEEEVSGSSQQRVED